MLITNINLDLGFLEIQDLPVFPLHGKVQELVQNKLLLFLPEQFLRIHCETISKYSFNPKSSYLYNKVGYIIESNDKCL